MTSQDLIQLIRGWSKEDAPTLRTIRAICNGKLSRRTLTEDQLKMMKQAKEAKAK